MIRLLGSTNLTVALCLLLAAGGIAGSLLYQGNTAYGKPPAFNVFRSPLFLAPAALLAINVCFCVIPRLRRMPARNPRSWSFAFLHLGLLLLAGGLSLDGLYGFVGTQYFPVGAPYSGYHNWGTDRDETFPFFVEVASAEARYHPRNLRIGVKDASGNKVGLYVAREGVPFPVGKEGVVVTPRAFDAESGTLRLDVSVGGRTMEGVIATKDAPAAVAGYRVGVVAFADPEPSDYVARVRFLRPGSAPQEHLLRINHPATFSGISFCIVAFDRGPDGNRILGLQMTREPGAPLFWAGASLFGLSLVSHLLLATSGRRHPASEEADHPEGPGKPGGAAVATGATVCLLLAVLPLRSFAFGVAIDQDATWSGEVRVTEPVSVERGATLRVLAGTVVLLSGEDRDADGCEDGYIQVFGTLRVEGEAGRPVRFERLHPDRAWREIFLKDARATIRNAVVEGAVWGLHVHDGEVRVEDSAIRGNGGGARMKGLGVTVVRSEIRGNGIGLRFWDGGPVVSASVIEENGTGLFYRDGTGGGKITGCRIRNREWDVKIGDWAVGDLDLSGNYWGARGDPPGPGRVRDFRENRNAGTVSFDRALAEPPAGIGAGGVK